MQIGAKIKDLRLSCGLTQEELADRCELTKGYISQLENDLTSPAIATLGDILSALGSDLHEFFSGNTDERIVFSDKDYFVKEMNEGVFTWLIPNSQKNSMEPIMLELLANSSSQVDMPHDGEEFGYVLEGEILLHLSNKKFKVKKNQSFYFNCSKTHFIENIGEKTAKIIWVSSPPNF
ncbi:MAG: XRE family transcriptional regulator [Clostridia bacterium]